MTQDYLCLSHSTKESFWMTLPSSQEWYLWFVEAIAQSWRERREML